MSTLSVQIIGLDEFIAAAKHSGANIRPLLSAALQNSATRIQRNVRQRAPHRTGELQRSVLTQVSYPTSMVTVESPYGEFVEDGTRPHVIEPVNKKALYWKGALNPYKRVMHPGTKPHPFFRPGVDESVVYVHDQFMKVVERLVAELAGHTV